MTDSTYNGLTNYETWAVGMCFDGNYMGEGTYCYIVEIVTAALENVEPNRYATPEQRTRWSVANALQEMIEDEPDLGAFYGLAGDMLGACWSRVNWYELADAWIENVKEQVAS
jgi:hypothetical protein